MQVSPYPPIRQSPSSNVVDFLSRERIGEEEAPPYVTGPPDEAPIVTGEPPRPRQHVTMIDDCVVEAVVARCGLTGAGLYVLLERRVGKDGCWVCTMTDLAAAFGCSVRHIRDTAAALEREGFLERSEATAYGGATIGIRWYLPKHLRTYGAEPTPESTPEPTPEPSCARVIEVVVTSSLEVDTSKGDTPLPPNARAEYPAEFETFWTQYPSGHGNKKKTAEVWRKLKPDAETRGRIMAGLARWNACDRWRRGYVKDAVVWLRDKWWQDEPPPPDPAPAPNGRHGNGEAAIDYFIRAGRGEA